MTKWLLLAEHLAITILHPLMILKIHLALLVVVILLVVGLIKELLLPLIGGVAGVGALQDINSSIGNGQTIGNFGLGNSGGTTGEAMETAASFSNGHTCTGVFSAAALLGGQIHVVFAPSNTSSASKWSSVTFRYLGSNSDGTETLGSSSFFPSATTINRSAMTHTYVSGFGANSKDYYTVQWGLGQTISVDPLAPMATRPFVIRFD